MFKSTGAPHDMFHMTSIVSSFPHKHWASQMVDFVKCQHCVRPTDTLDKGTKRNLSNSAVGTRPAQHLLQSPQNKPTCRIIEPQTAADYLRGRLWNRTETGQIKKRDKFELFNSNGLVVWKRIYVKIAKEVWQTKYGSWNTIYVYISSY